MIEIPIRKFALLVVDDFDNVIDRFNLDYVETPKNLGFEIEFTTLESRLTTYFTSAREKRLNTQLNLNFLGPNAYLKVNAFRVFVQKYTNSRMVFEYNDTTSEIKNWEGKVISLGQTELEEWGGLVCPLVFRPGTPKYIRKDNTITIRVSSVGKMYPFKYPYAYGKSVTQNNEINNNYFDEIPLRVTVYGVCSNPVLSLTDESGEVYTSVRFNGLSIQEGEYLIVDAIQSKIWLYRNGRLQNGYDYLDKSEQYDSFLWAKENTTSRLVSNLTGSTGYIQASYRQYIL